MDTERYNDINFNLIIATITPCIFLELLGDKFIDTALFWKYFDIKRAKIWCVDGEKNSSWGLGMAELLHLLDRVTENKVKELRFRYMDLVECYYGATRDGLGQTNPSFNYVYSGWTVKTVSVRNCIIGKEFFENILTNDSQFIDGNNFDVSRGKNLIEEIRIINCEIVESNGCIRNSVKELVAKKVAFRREILKTLETNYRVRIINIEYTTKTKISRDVKSRNHLNIIQYEPDEPGRLDDQIKILLDRNNRGYHLCQSAIQTVLLIKKYKNSVLDLLGRDIVKVICQLLLDTKGTQVWSQK